MDFIGRPTQKISKRLEGLASVLRTAWTFPHHWVKTHELNWDKNTIGYIVWKVELAQAAAITLRRMMSSIRYIHLSVGLPEPCGVRYKMLSKSYSRTLRQRRKPPFQTWNFWCGLPITPIRHPTLHLASRFGARWRYPYAFACAKAQWGT